MPIFEWACHECRVMQERFGSYEECGKDAACDICGEPMQRVFTNGMAVLNRQKPGSFKKEKHLQSGWDSRVWHLKDAENKDGTAGLRKMKEQVGSALFNQTLAYKKANYAS